MSSRSHERRTERATAEDVAEVERQLWEFAKRIDPHEVPEAKLRPGAYLWRIHRTWHDLGRGMGGLASRSFRALKEELLRRDPPVRNLQPKLYGNSLLSRAEAEQLVDVMLETWHLERTSKGQWKANPLLRLKSKSRATRRELETIRENLLQTLFRGEDSLLLEESVGVPPEIFFKERGENSLALILPTKSETIARLSPSNAYGGFSSGLSQFLEAANARIAVDDKPPLLIWVLRFGTIRDNAEFHQSFHAISIHSAAITNLYLRLSKKRGSERKIAEEHWDLILNHSAFAIHGLPNWLHIRDLPFSIETIEIDDDLAELTPYFFLPNPLPVVLSNHRQVRRHHDHDFGLNVSIERDHTDDETNNNTYLSYWLLPDEPSGDLVETAETTGLPVFNADVSPGADFDAAYSAIYNAVSIKLGLSNDKIAQRALATLTKMGWQILNVKELQNLLQVRSSLAFPEKR